MNDVLLLLGVSLVGELTRFFRVPGMMRLYDNRCEFFSMVDTLVCLFGKYHRNNCCRLFLWYDVLLILNFYNHLLRL